VKVLDLFSGLGGFSLGLERAGMTTVAFCEIDPYCRRVLAKHWPDVPIYDDVRTLTADALRRDGIADVDVICGGFPCQDISRAGGQVGLDGERSGLWSEIARLVGELRPSLVIVENVAALLDNGMGRVLGDLSDLRYDAEGSIVSACSVGLPIDGRARLRNTVARADGALPPIDSFEGARARSRARLANPSALYRGADGVPNGPQRNRAIGNAIVPIISELIGRAIMSLEPTR